MGLLRCFIAIELPASIQAAVDEATMGLRTALGEALVRWVPARNVHLTLKFLGDTAESAVGTIGSILMAEASQHGPLEFHVGDLGAFPSRTKPRVLWIGLTAPPELAAMQRELDMETVRIGYASDERSFSPHLTIGRVRQNLQSTDVQKISGQLARTAIAAIGSFTVHQVHLYSSELLPTGSRYTKLISAPLGGALDRAHAS